MKREEENMKPTCGDQRRWPLWGFHGRRYGVLQVQWCYMWQGWQWGV